MYKSKMYKSKIEARINFLRQKIERGTEYVNDPSRDVTEDQILRQEKANIANEKQISLLEDMLSL